MTEIQPADPRARRRALILYFVCVFVGLLLIAAFSMYEQALLDWLERNVESIVTYRLPVVLAALLLAAPLFLMSGHLWRYANRCIDAGRMPPPGCAVVRPTPVRTGAAAVRNARFLQGLALLVALSGLALPVLCWRILSMFAG